MTAGSLDAIRSQFRYSDSRPRDNPHSGSV